MRRRLRAQDRRSLAPARYGRSPPQLRHGGAGRRVRPRSLLVQAVGFEPPQVAPPGPNIAYVECWSLLSWLYRACKPGRTQSGRPTPWSLIPGCGGSSREHPVVPGPDSGQAALCGHLPLVASTMVGVPATEPRLTR